MNRESPLWKIWMKTARVCGDRVVVIEAATGESWTAEALTKLANSSGDTLAEFSPGQRMAFQLPNGAQWLAFFLALQKKGLVAMPLDGGLPLAGCLDISRRLGARAFFDGENFHEISATASRSRTCCYVKTTSGSSAVPKAIACRAEHLLADGRQVMATMGIRARDRNMAAIPLGHSYGLGNLVMPLILQGTALICAGDFLPRQLMEWIERYEVTVFPSVPAIFRVLATLPSGPHLTQLRTVISAGAMLAPEVARAFHQRFGVKIHNFYGSSETGGISYDRAGTASLTGRSVGKPLRGVSIEVAAGRVTVKSRAVVTPSGKWRLPDRGEWNLQGELVLLGRIGQGANIGGKKVHPLEIERALRGLPAVTDAQVWLVHRQGRDVLAAAVESTATSGAIERELAAKLPAWKIPKVWRVAAELPRTERGKLDGARLREQLG